jgi:hypothetical protein
MNPVLLRDAACEGPDKGNDEGKIMSKQTNVSNSSWSLRGPILKVKK